MSRLGKRILSFPEDVKLEVNANSTLVRVVGPLGILEKKLPGSIKIIVDESQRTVATTWNKQNKKGFEMWGTTNSLLYNWILGVKKGFSKRLLINGLGFKAKVIEQNLQLNLGFSHHIDFKIPKDIQINVGKNVVIDIKGFDKELVGLVASQIRKLRKPEPYKGKGIMYHDEKVQRKVGKTAASKK